MGVFLFHRCCLPAAFFFLLSSLPAAEPARRIGTRRDEPMVDVAVACPRVAIELRYATPRNVTGACIYSPDARCFVRESVATRLRKAQESLDGRGVRLKIWDSYRPVWAQKILWQTIQNAEVIGNPAKGGSLHSWGACVDVTLVDGYGRELLMPSDFDEFTPAAASSYRGSDARVAANLKLLQSAMSRAGFVKMRDEWWHFTAPDALSFAVADLPLAVARPPQPAAAKPRLAAQRSVTRKAAVTRHEAAAPRFQFRTPEPDLRTSASL